MEIRDRIGVDISTDMSVREGVEWAVENEVYYVDFCLDDGPLDPESYDPAEVDAIRDRCEDHDISVGLHTNSAMNVAETSPYVSAATDEYLTAYIDIAEKLGADRIIVHGGYHFTSDVTERTRAAKERLGRALDYATDVTLLLENHNFEPDDSEIHYMPVTLEECVDFFEDLESPAFGWAFNPPHARLFPEGIEGFVDRLGVGWFGEVRLNDNNGEVEEHLYPGEGTMDFERMFQLLEAEGYSGHYMLSYCTPEEMLESRDYLVDRFPAPEA